MPFVQSFISPPLREKYTEKYFFTTKEMHVEMISPHSAQSGEQQGVVRTGEVHGIGYTGQLGINAKWLLAGQYVGSMLPNLFFFSKREVLQMVFKGKLGDLFFKCYFSGWVKSAYGSSAAVSGVNLWFTGFLIIYRVLINFYKFIELFTSNPIRMTTTGIQWE